jgi:hypothetical protein
MGRLYTITLTVKEEGEGEEGRRVLDMGQQEEEELDQILGQRQEEEEEEAEDETLPWSWIV